MSSCVKFKESFISPGRVNKDSLKLHIDFFRSVADSMSGTQRKYEVIGHGISSWRNYPMRVSKKGSVVGNNNTDAQDIITLIDNSMVLDPTISIELDAQYAPENDKYGKKYPKGAFILHDIPKWGKNRMLDSDVTGYLHRNTIKKAVDHFVKRGYYKTSKMYIEIKLAKKCFRSSDLLECDNQFSSLANELVTYANDYKRDGDDNWLCITSFSPTALDRFRNYLPDTVKKNCDYILIAGYTGGWVKSKLAQLKGYVPRFDDCISSFVVNTEWLEGVWFASQGIKNFKSLFASIVETRRKFHPDWNEIGFSFSTYQYKASKMKKTLMKCPDKKINIKSFMLDFDDMITEDYKTQ